MNLFTRCLLVLMIAVTGCRPQAYNRHVSSGGDFTINTNTSTILWKSLSDSETNSIQFILLVPEQTGLGSGSQTHGDLTYDYWNLKIKNSGHIWKIETHGNLDTGNKSLSLSDQTIDTTTNLDLEQNRWWRLSENGQLTPLDKMDPAIIDRVQNESEEGFKKIQNLRPR